MPVNPRVEKAVQQALFKHVSGSHAHRLRDFVTQTVSSYVAVSGFGDISPYGPTSLPNMTSLVVQATDRAYLQGRDLTPEAVFTVENIHAVVPKGVRASNAKRLALVRIAEFSLGYSLDIEGSDDEPKKGYARPYLPEDFPKIRQWAVARTTQYGRELTEGALALCLGAGLMGKQAVTVKAGDVREDSNGVVWVPQGLNEPPRPVATVFTQALLELRGRREPDQLLLGGKEKPASLQTLNVGREFKVFPARLRMTWYVAVAATTNADVASTALGTKFLYPYLKFSRKDGVRPDPIEDHAHELVDPFTNWPALRADQRWQPTPAPEKPVAKETGPQGKTERKNTTDVPVQQQEQYPCSGVTDELARKQRSTFEVIDGGKK